MSRRPASASAAAATLPECEPPRIRLGAPIITAMPCARQAAAASAVVGNSAMRAPWPAEAATCAARGVVVAGERRAEAARARRPPRPRAARRCGAPMPVRQRDVGLELVLVHAAPAGGVVAELGDVGELPLAGGVVHQAEDADPVRGGELVELRRRASPSRSRRAGAAGGGCAARRRACRRLISVASGRAYLP